MEKASGQSPEGDRARPGGAPRKVACVEGDDAGHCDACLGGTKSLKHLLDLWGWGCLWGVRGHCLEPAEGPEQAAETRPVAGPCVQGKRKGDTPWDRERNGAVFLWDRTGPSSVPCVSERSSAACRSQTPGCQELSGSPGPDHADPLATEPFLKQNRTWSSLPLAPGGPSPHS